MLVFLTSAALAAAGADLPRPDGAALAPGRTCYAITRDGRTIGATLQTIRATRDAGRPAWDIVVHQRMDDGSFDMRDHFVLARRTLLPIRIDSRRGIDPAARGWQRITLAYRDGRVTGTRVTAKGSTPIDATLAGPTWDGNLWGATFAALPLRRGARFTLPMWQYDKGAGQFALRVVGEENVATPRGPQGAWVVEAGDDPSRPIRYLIGKRLRMELGYSAGGFGQTLGGDCRAIGTDPLAREP